MDREQPLTRLKGSPGRGQQHIASTIFDNAAGIDRHLIPPHREHPSPRVGVWRNELEVNSPATSAPEAAGRWGPRLVRLRYAWLRVREEGALWTLKELARRGLYAPIWLLLLPATLVLHFAGLRRLTIITGRVGHFAAEIDCFLKLRHLGKLASRRYFVLAPPARVANTCLADYWQRHVTFVRDARLSAVLEAMSRFGLMRHDVSDYILTLAGPATYYRVNAEWAERPPLLMLAPEHAAEGRRALERLGVPRDAWFVGVHVREGGYSRGDDKVHAFRNADVEAVVPAMRAIVEHGGWCLRMGDPSMPPLPPLTGVVDYAHSPLRSPEMDVFLCASSRCFLGNTSGLFILSSIFGVPCALANMVPFATMPYAARDLCIPKLLRLEKGGAYLSFPEILASPLANYRMGRMLFGAGVRVVDNSAEEIVELAVEMLDRLDGQHDRYAAGEPLQARFRQLLTPAHYCYGSASRIGTRFLERHRGLLDGQSAAS